MRDSKRNSPVSTFVRSAGLLLFAAAAQLSGCVREGPPPNEPEVPAELGSPVDYMFGTVDGELLGSAHLRGRVTVLLFVTTFDLASQAQAKRLEDAVRTHAPRINAVAVVLEAPRYVDLARAFRDVVGVHYPVVMADSATLEGAGPWGRVRAVPTWAVLDAAGRLRALQHGALNPSELDALLEDAR